MYVQEPFAIVNVIVIEAGSAMDLNNSTNHVIKCRGAYIEKDTGALVCTIEKANQLVGRMMEEQSLGELGALIVDELHMVADDDRWVK